MSPLQSKPRLEELLRLQSEAESLREQSSNRERELRAEMDKLRRDKRELELQLGGLTEARMAEEDRMVRELQQELAAAREQSRRIIGGLETRLRTYEDNAGALEESRRLLREQTATIQVRHPPPCLSVLATAVASELLRDRPPGPAALQALERRLGEFEGPSAPGMTPAKRIRELEAEVKRLQSALKDQDPNSLTALVLASKPAPEESAAVAALQAELGQLTGQLEGQARDHEARSLGTRSLHPANLTCLRPVRRSRTCSSRCARCGSSTSGASMTWRGRRGPQDAAAAPPQRSRRRQRPPLTAAPPTAAPAAAAAAAPPLP